MVFVGAEDEAGTAHQDTVMDAEAGEMVPVLCGGRGKGRGRGRGLEIRMRTRISGVWCRRGRGEGEGGRGKGEGVRDQNESQDFRCLVQEGGRGRGRGLESNVNQDFRCVCVWEGVHVQVPTVSGLWWRGGYVYAPPEGLS